MKIQRCFDILELPPEATPEEARQAYKDIVNVWHPDRFSNNPRLRRKAELKVKEINAAYAEIKAFMAARDDMSAGGGRASTESQGPPEDGADDASRDRAEVLAEAGTRLVLGIWSYLSKAAARLSDDRRKGGKTNRPGNDPERG